MTTSLSSLASSLSVSIPAAIRRAAQPLMDRTRPGCPGKVLEYDPKTRRAKVQVQGQLVVTADGGEEEVLDIETAEGVPVRFAGGGGFFLIHDVKPEDQGWISFSHFSLDQWKTDGTAGKVQVKAGGYALKDAVFEPNVDVSHPGVECPRGCMLIGAENGPRITWDTNRVALDLTALTELTLAAGARLLIKAASVVIDGVLRTQQP